MAIQLMMAYIKVSLQQFYFSGSGSNNVDPTDLGEVEIGEWTHAATNGIA